MDKNINKNKMMNGAEVDKKENGDKPAEFAETMEERPVTPLTVEEVSDFGSVEFVSKKNKNKAEEFAETKEKRPVTPAIREEVGDCESDSFNGEEGVTKNNKDKLTKKSAKPKMGQTVSPVWVVSDSETTFSETSIISQMSTTLVELLSTQMNQAVAEEITQTSDIMAIVDCKWREIMERPDFPNIISREEQLTEERRRPHLQDDEQTFVSPAVVPQSIVSSPFFKELGRCILIKVEEYIDARFKTIEHRLLPEKSLESPSALDASESMSEPATQEMGQSVGKGKGKGKKKKKNKSQKESHDGEDKDAKKHAEDVINRYKEMLELKEFEEKTKEKRPITPTAGEKWRTTPVEDKIEILRRNIVKTNEEKSKLLKERQLVKELKRLRLLDEEQKKIVSSAVSKDFWKACIQQEMLWELKDFNIQLKALEEIKNQDSLPLVVEAPVIMPVTPQMDMAVKTGKSKEKKSKAIAATELTSNIPSQDLQQSTSMTRATETGQKSPPSLTNSSGSSNKQSKTKRPRDRSTNDEQTFVSPAVVPQSILSLPFVKELERCILFKVGEYIDARFKTIEHRLLPEKSLESPSALDASENMSEPATQEMGQAVRKGKGKKKNKDKSEKESHDCDDENAKKHAEDVINRYKEMLELKEFERKTKEERPNTPTVGEKWRTTPVEEKIEILRRKIVKTNEEKSKLLKERQLVKELKRLRLLDEEQKKIVSSAVSKDFWKACIQQEMLWELKDFNVQLKALEEIKNQDSLPLVVEAPVIMSVTPQLDTAVKTGKSKEKKPKAITVTELISTISSQDLQQSTRATETGQKSPPSQTNFSGSSNKQTKKKIPIDRSGLTEGEKKLLTRKVVGSRIIWLLRGASSSKDDSFEPKQDSLETVSEGTFTAPEDLTSKGSDSKCVNSWWSEELEQLRRDKVCKRRKYARLGRRRLFTDEEKAEARRLAYEEYRPVSKAFKEAVKIAKLASKSNEEKNSKETV